MTEMNFAEDPVIDILLRYDLERFAAKLGYYSAAAEQLKPEVATRALNLAEQLSRVAIDDDGRNLCLTLCGLVWEHRDPAWEAVPSFLIQILARLGLGPTTAMVDPDYNQETAQHSGLGSFLGEMQTTAFFLEQEVAVGSRFPLLLSKFQKDLWDALDGRARLAVSAPTSAGKSFLLVEKIADLLLKGAKKIVYIVPTLSLVHQVTRDLRRACLRYNIQNAVITQSFAEIERGAAVFVLTQERAASGLVSDVQLGQVDLLIVDEIQNIERVATDDEERARILYNALQEFLLTVRPQRVVVSGPRLTELQKLAEGLLGKGAVALTADLPPVVSLTYTFRKQGRRVLLRQYSSVRDDPQDLLLDADVRIDRKVFGQREYREPFYNFLSAVVRTCEREGGTIVFSPTTDQARKTAETLKALVDPSMRTEASELAAYIEESVHRSYSLAACVREGTAFHHSKLPLHLRHAVESAFSANVVRVLACTTTLMQGVNLPAKSIIARNPNLFIKEKNNAAKLTNYEFANLRGRAGRLMRDFVGRAIVLDEEPFHEAQISFDLPEKEVRPGYGERFETHRSEVVQALISHAPQDESSTGFGDLVVHIRHTILRHGARAQSRLARVGIVLSSDEFERMVSQLKVVDLPQDVLSRCTGWDPVILQQLYDSRSRVPPLPNFPLERGFDDRLKAVLDRLQSLTPYYYQKYLGTEPNSLISVLISARRWSAEEPLSAILSWGRDRYSEVTAADIEYRLELIQSTVMYDLPKLLRPIALMQNPENPLLSYMELGAHRAETRTLIQQGLPREPSRVVVDYWRRTRMTNAFSQLSLEAIPDLLRSTLPALNRWEREQVLDIFPILGRSSIRVR